MHMLSFNRKKINNTLYAGKRLLILDSRCNIGIVRKYDFMNIMAVHMVQKHTRRFIGLLHMAVPASD